SPIQVGLLGFGLAGSVFHAPLILAEASLRLTKIMTRRGLTLECLEAGATAVATPDAIFNDPAITLVVIATPNQTHFPLAEAALTAGKNVVIDKPFCLNLAEAEQLAALAAAKNKLLTVFHNRRLDAHFLTVQAALDSGLIGRPLLADLHFDRYRPLPKDNWREKPEPGAGLYFDLAPHLIDQARQLFGDPASITAHINSQRPEARVDDSFLLVLAYENHPLRVTLRASMLVAEPAPRMVIHGSQGTILQTGFDEQEDDLRMGKRPGDPEWGVCKSLQIAIHQMTEQGKIVIDYPHLKGCYTEFYHSVANAINHGSPPVVTTGDALRIMQIIEAGWHSSQKGQTVRL
ncbi:MAG: Gfo/Idh/MocA family oxidoreductase, partial [Candidatus Pacebacteria bacterium]|nr:Gfo/Idh/MocA family oxidoreductase [Candidatus Paceibacterota bacterium]